MEIITDDAGLRASGFYWSARGKVRLLVCSRLEEYGFTNGFSTRTGGCSPMPGGDLNLAGFNDDEAENIHENRRRFLQMLDHQWSLASCWQVHGSNVRTVRDHADSIAETERCDALTTNLPGVLLAIKTADCVPVLLADQPNSAVAAVHAGWRGTLATITVSAVKRMREEYGTKPEDLRVAIGPAAGSCCYEVGPEVIGAFQRRFRYAGELVSPTAEGRGKIDLRDANRRQLIAAGVDEHNIHVAPFCTMCRNDIFFSYRLEKKLHGRVGRLLSVIGIKNEADLDT